MERTYLTQPPELGENQKPKVMALGYFDGVHIGHQKVIRTAVDIAKKEGLEACVMTFHPHPSIVLKQLNKRDDYLTPPDDKAEFIADLGVDRLYFVTFNEAFSKLSPEEFVNRYLVGLDVRHVVAGFDYTYGHKAQGTMETLPIHSQGRFTVTTIPKLSDHGEKISTTSIRNLIQEGQVETAARYLGRNYRMKGTVVHGEKRGKKIGFPTANIDCLAPYVFPAAGVYNVLLKWNNNCYPGVCNIGYPRAFHSNDTKLTIEVHLLDFQGDLYGQPVEIFWYRKIRDEHKFSGVDELIKQIQKDKNTSVDDFKKPDLF